MLDISTFAPFNGVTNGTRGGDSDAVTQLEGRKEWESLLKCDERRRRSEEARRDSHADEKEEEKKRRE